MIDTPKSASGKGGTSVLLKCMHYWYHWNSLVRETADWIYRIEDVDYAEICAKVHNIHNSTQHPQQLLLSGGIWG